MSKQLIIVIGAPYSGRTTWINKNYSSKNYVIIDANEYPNLYVKSERTNISKLFEDTIEDSRTWCLEHVKTLMEEETTNQNIVLSLIANRPDRWKEFIQLAIHNEYELVFKFPTNKNLFYQTRHNTSIEQSKFIESQVIKRYPKDKKEVNKKGKNGCYEYVTIETNESTLLRQTIIETESAYSFYLQNKIFFANKEELIEKINEYYKKAIIGDIKRAEKKLRDSEKEQEKKERENIINAERETKREEKIKKELEIVNKLEVQLETQTQTETEIIN